MLQNFPKIFFDYQESYRTRGVSLLITSILRNLGKKFDTFSIIEDGVFRHFWFDKEEYAKKVVEICSDEDKFNSYLNKLDALEDELQTKLIELNKNENFSVIDLENLLDFFQRVTDFYLVMDFGDQAYSWAIKQLNPDELARFKIIEQTKNSSRDRLIMPALGDENSLVINFFKKIANQFDISIEEILWYTIDEARELFVGQKIPSAEILKRKKNSIIYSFNSEVAYIYGIEAEDITNKFNNKVGRDITGLSVYSNKTLIKGKVKIFKLDYSNSNQISDFLENFRDGDILIAEVTTPAMLPIMKKSAAMIVDFGGIMTHAAIISRELKIPCIIGTKIATQVLKDGDMVEVDADNGVVRKID